MILKIRFENDYQTLELDEESKEKLWVSLSLECEDGTPQEEREQMIQDAFDDVFNKQEYNVWHRETRHIDSNPKPRRMDGRRGYIQAEPDDKGFNAMDYLQTVSDDEKRERDVADRETYAKVRRILSRKPKWADAFIAVRLEGQSVNEYAASIGVKDASAVSKWLARAEKKLRENWR